MGLILGFYGVIVYCVMGYGVGLKVKIFFWAIRTTDSGWSNTQNRGTPPIQNLYNFHTYHNDPLNP